MPDNELRMTFDPYTIQHLGLKMYSSLSSAIAELVANAYDACSSEVRIRLHDDDEKEKYIVVQDKGLGMSFDELNTQFLIIGRNRREEGFKETPCNRIASGKKGLGKLALFGIGGQVDIETTKRGEDTTTKLSLVWEDLKNWDRRTQGPDYKPEFQISESDPEEHGTTITVAALKRKSDITGEYVKDLAISLSKLFNFLDDNFRVSISLNDGDDIQITNDLRYENTECQFEWGFPEYAEKIEYAYDKKGQIGGRIFTAPKPLPNKKQTGITLFAHGRRVNLPEFFGHIESSNFFSYATGWLNVDFVDDYDEDVISTDRKSIDWEHEDMVLLRNYLKAVVSRIHSEWRAARKKTDKDKVGVNTGINKERWFGTLPPDKAEIIDKALEEVSDPDSSRKPADVLFETSHSLAPEYAELHWRYLHSEIHGIAKDDYEGGKYFDAAEKASRLYLQRVKDIAGVDSGSDMNDMETVFNPGNGRLMVTDCSDTTEKNIQNGQHFLSRGIVAGCRNPLAHNPEYDNKLVQTGLFDKKVCLDMLAMISHLFTRLEKAKLREVDGSDQE